MNDTMKTKEEILDECGVRIFGAQKARILEAMENYTKQKLLQHGVMQAEGSDVCDICDKNEIPQYKMCKCHRIEYEKWKEQTSAKEATVGNSAAGQSGSVGSRTIYHKDGTVSFVGKYDGPEG